MIPTKAAAHTHKEDHEISAAIMQQPLKRPSHLSRDEFLTSHRPNAEVQQGILAHKVLYCTVEET